MYKNCSEEFRAKISRNEYNTIVHMFASLLSKDIHIENGIDFDLVQYQIQGIIFVWGDSDDVPKINIVVIDPVLSDIKMITSSMSSVKRYVRRILSMFRRPDMSRKGLSHKIPDIHIADAKSIIDDGIYIWTELFSKMYGSPLVKLPSKNIYINGTLFKSFKLIDNVVVFSSSVDVENEDEGTLQYGIAFSEDDETLDEIYKIQDQLNQHQYTI